MGGGHVFPTDSHRLQLQGHDSSSGAGPPGVNLLTDPNLHMMGLGLSSQTMDWNQALFRGEKAESSFRSMLQEDEGQGNANFQQDSQEQWRHKLLFGGSSSGDQDDSSVTHHDHFKQFNRGGLSLDQPQYSSSQSSNNNSTATNFQVVDSAPPYRSSPNVVQGLLVSSDNNSNNHNHQTQSQSQSQSAFDHSRSINYSYAPAASYAINTAHDHQLIPSNSWSKFPQFLRASSSSPPAAKQPPAHGQLHFSNNTPFWNAISTPNNISTDARSSFFPSLHQTQQLATSSSFEEKPKQITSEVRDLTKKTSSNTTAEASNKRSRNETTPSPMPAFKVRKEKMGDRITALQQLVSPFGKTDTASVLSEAIEYIKFLHEQVSVLTTPYMKSGAHVQHPTQIPHDKSKDPEGPKQDLRSRGLCLVPVPSTFPVMNESNFELWNPTFGGTYR